MNVAEANTDLFPQYQSHKKVRAAKIKSIDETRTDAPEGFSAALEFEGNLPGFFVTPEFMQKHKPQVGGYIVLYDDGYKSWSPAEAFESGYMPVAFASRPTDEQLEACARTAHEANRAYCLTLGDTSQLPWESAPDWQRSSALAGVLGVIAGYGPEKSHEGWLAEKAAAGWKYGPIKNPETKEHPCFVPYAELPAVQKSKDYVFVGVVRSMLAAFASNTLIEKD